MVHSSCRVCPHGAFFIMREIFCSTICTKKCIVLTTIFVVLTGRLFQMSRIMSFSTIPKIIPKNTKRYECNQTNSWSQEEGERRGFDAQQVVVFAFCICSLGSLDSLMIGFNLPEFCLETNSITFLAGEMSKGILIASRGGKNLHIISAVVACESVHFLTMSVLGIWIMSGVMIMIKLLYDGHAKLDYFTLSREVPSS